MRPNFAAIERDLADPSLPPEKRREIEELLNAYALALELNPLEGFYPHSKPQKQFLEARTPVQAAFCGNQFGKTAALIIKCFAQHVPLDKLPSHLKRVKLAKEEPVYGWLMIPAFRLLETVYLPELRKWAPKAYLWDGSFDKAWKQDKMVLRFADGGMLHVFTYEQDPDKMVGARLDYVAYDEPPPKPVRSECAMRLVARGGFEAFAMTPVNIAGGGIGWIHNELWLKREHPDITVVNGSIHDNPLLDKKTVARTLSRYSDEERRAREFGEFVHVGGMVYPGGFERALVDAPSPEHVRDLSVVVGIDPGLKNAAFIWVGFDSDNCALVFDEVLLQDKTPADYAKAIRDTNAKWGLERPLYVIDPSARNRSLTNAENVEGELARLGIYCAHGQNAVEAGVQQVRRRLQAKLLLVSKDCHKLKLEADLYRMEDRSDGEFQVVKEDDHLLDSLRYALMHRPYLAPYDTPKKPVRSMFEAWPPNFPKEQVPPTGALT